VFFLFLAGQKYMFKLQGIGRANPTSNNSTSGAAPGATTEPKMQPGQIRMQTEMQDLDLPSQAKLKFLNSSDLMNFKVEIKPDEGFWKSGLFVFEFQIKAMYPHDPPKVKCLTQIYHPNIDKDGNVCLNILREDWKPILSVSSVIYGLLHLFLEPNPNDPLNQQAAEDLRNSKSEFTKNVDKSLRGGTVHGIQYPRLL
jgi:ubiquitin-conjugating enzyme E2 M